MVEVTPIDVCYSSQDPAFPALNLVRGATKSSDERKQWLCSSPDEKFAHITLTYEKPFVISSLEIKNYGSAYVQVEGGHSNEPGRFKTLWRMQTLMTPSESRLGNEIDGTYLFLPQDLPTSEKDKMWDLLKITCSQPFNKLRQYGLSHVVARSALPVKEENPSSPNNCDVALENFKCEPDGDGVTGNEQAHKQRGTTADHRTQMSSEVSSSGCSEVTNTLISPVKQENSSDRENFYSSPGRSSEPSSSSVHDVGLSPDHLHSHESPPIKQEVFDDKEVVVSPLKRPSLTSLPTSRSSNVAPVKRRLSESDLASDSDSDEVLIIKRPAPSNIIYKPFNKLLEGVQIVISGFQNPYRAEIRYRAMQMGASYSPAWSENSTHLICAFLYTPKYRQAAGEGLIVSRDWIDQCFLQRKRLPWARFALNPSEICENSGEVEIWAIESTQSVNSSSQGSPVPLNSLSSNERSVSSSPVQLTSDNQSVQAVPQARPPSSIVGNVAEVKREASESVECPYASHNSEQEALSLQTPAQLSIANNHLSNQGISIKTESTEGPFTFWDGGDCQRSLASLPANNTALQGGSGIQHATHRSQSSNLSSSQMPIRSDQSAFTFAHRADREAFRSPGLSNSHMEQGSDGYAGYYRPISQPCSVPHSSQSAAYLVPPVIMLPQSLPQYFVPFSQQLQLPPASREPHVRVPASSPQSHHIRVIQPPSKPASATENSKQS